MSDDDEQVFIKEYDKPIPDNIEKLQNYLANSSQVIGVQHRLSETFVSIFLQNFGNFPIRTNEIQNRSNWTHHVYFSMRSTSNTLYLSCTFEIMGRLDAVIETLDQYPGVILVAEWESNSNSIFGTHNELEKLWIASNKYQNADAFLLTYCPIESLFGFTKQVVEYWQNLSSDRENFPSLFLVIVAQKREGRDNRFLFIRTQEIAKSSLFLWHDIGLVTGTEYLKSVSNL